MPDPQSCCWPWTTPQQADVRLALKDIANVVRSKTPAELIADEYRSLNPGAAIVAVRPDAPNRFGLIHNIAAAGGVVIVVSPTKDPELILRSMRAGAREFVLESDHEELRAGGARAGQGHGRGRRASARWSPSSAPRGAWAPPRSRSTSRAPCSGAALRVCCSISTCTSATCCRSSTSPGTYSITDVLANMSRLDRELLAHVGDASTASGISVLAQSGKVEEAEQIKAPDVAGAARSSCAATTTSSIVDGVRGFDELSLAALDGSQHVFMALTQDVPAVRNGQRCLELFGRLRLRPGDGSSCCSTAIRRPRRSPSRSSPRRSGQPLTAHDQQRLHPADRRHQPRRAARRRGAAREDHPGHRGADPAPAAGARAAACAAPSFLGTLFGKKVADGTT